MNELRQRMIYAKDKLIEIIKVKKWRSIQGHCRTADFLLRIHSGTAEFLRADCGLLYMKALEPPEKSPWSCETLSEIPG